MVINSTQFSSYNKYQRYPQEGYGYGQLFGGNETEMVEILRALLLAPQPSRIREIEIQTPWKGADCGRLVECPRCLIPICDLLIWWRDYSCFCFGHGVYCESGYLLQMIVRLLAPILARLGGAGTIREGREMCEALWVRIR
jgi:hypothetical protein